MKYSNIREEYWNYIVDRQDLLVPQDVRERKGSFYTPKIWVELSQKYLADVLGTDWQDEYFIWDCAAGTGNLLAGLTNKYNIWASTLDKADVDVMKDRIQNGANLLEEHVFQFDFLNDDFAKLPQDLLDIINDPKLRKRLIVYINPPYAETNNKYSGDRSGVSETKIGKKYANILGEAKKELFAQFFARIFCEIPSCTLANFSKLKILQAPNFNSLRNAFQSKLEKMFIVPANTFDNVTGQFPIGFMIWNTSKKQIFSKISSDVYDNQGNYSSQKMYYAYTDKNYINDWIKKFRDRISEKIGVLYYTSNDFQQQNSVSISSPEEIFKNHLTKFSISIKNIIETSIYFTVRKVIPATWLNDRDQFLYPNDLWKKDIEFQNDCLTYTLFNNNISTKHGVNHWIPFEENEVNAQKRFESHFMISFISGKLIPNRYSDLFAQEEDKSFSIREFSAESKKVFDAGRELWRYYHTQHNCNVNASLYDIREHFQGRNDNGKMNNKSCDEHYNELIGNLRLELKTLASKIEPKVYEYKFLLE